MLNGFTETSPHAYASPSNELHYNESRARYIIEINNSCRNVRHHPYIPMGNHPYISMGNIDYLSIEVLMRHAI